MILLITLSPLSTLTPRPLAQEKAAKRDKIDLGGKAEIGIDFEASGGLAGKPVTRSRLERIGIVEIELEIRPADSVEVEFDLEYDHRFADVNLQKLFARYNFDNSNARLGFMKKMFTLEEIKSSRDNLFARRSMLNDILEDFFLLGHDFTAQYRYNFPDYTVIGGYSADGNNRNFLNATLISKYPGRINFIAAGMYENYHAKDGSEEGRSAFFTNLGMTFDGERTDFEIEGIWGYNPEEYGYYNIIYGTEYRKSDIGIVGLRFQESFTFMINRKHLNAVVPLYELACFSDSFSKKRAYWQARAGVNVCFTEKNRLQWRNNVEMIVSARDQESDDLRIVSQKIISEILVLW